MPEQRIAVVDQIVGQQHGDALAGGKLLAVRHRVAEAAGIELVDLVHGGQLGRAAHQGERVGVALLLQRVLEFVVGTEVVGDRGLVRADDEQHVGDAVLGRLGDDELQRRSRHDRRELFGDGLGERQEPGAASGGRDECLADRTIRHVPRLTGPQCTAA